DSVQAVAFRPTPEIAKTVQSIGADKTEALLRYYAYEAQRRYVKAWGVTQIVLGCGLIILLVYATRINRLAIGLGAAMLVLAAFAYFALAPEIHFLRHRVDLATWSA